MVGTLTAHIGITDVTVRAAAPTGGSALAAATINQSYAITAAFSSSGVLTGFSPGQQLRTPILAGAGTLAVSSKQIYPQTANLTGGGVLSAVAVPATTRTAGFASLGQLTASATIAATPGSVTIIQSDGSYNTAASTRSPSVTFAGYTPVLNDVVFLWAATPAASLLYDGSPAGWASIWGTTGDNSIYWTSNYRLSSGLYHFVDAADVTANRITYTATNYLSATAFQMVLGVVLRGVSLSDPIDSASWMGANSPTHKISGTDLNPYIDNPNGLWLAPMCKGNNNLYPAAPSGWTTLRSGRATTTTLGAYALMARNTRVGPADLPLSDVTISSLMSGTYLTFSNVISAG